MLYTIGCSFTYGYELEDRTKTAWPYLLGNLLQTDVMNLAIPGISNDYIVRTTMTNVLAQTITPNDFVIVGWTGEFRKDFYDNTEQKYVTLKHQRTYAIDDQNYMFITNDHLDDVHSITTLFFNTFYNNILVAIIDKLQSILLLDAFLSQHGIKHIFFNAVGNIDLKNISITELRNLQKEQNISIMNNYNVRYKCLQECVNMILSPSMEQFCLKYPMGKYYHPLEEGHNSWAEYLYNFMLKKKTNDFIC